MTHSINLQAIASRYGGKVCGDTALIPTPGHSAKDRGTSIKLDQTAPDGCLVHCHNGSGSDALAVKDMLRRDGFLPERTSTFVGPDGPDLTALLAPKMGDEGAFEPAFYWDYYDADGTLCYRKHRTDLPDGSKTFWFEHRDKNGQWANSRGNSAHHLYRLPHLIESTGPIFVAEGERCADYLVYWGFEATSSKDLPKADLDVFKGRTAFILPDNDTPGRQYADEAHEAILVAGGMPVIVELQNLPDKGDILDWDGTREDLISILPTVLPLPAKPAKPWLVSAAEFLARPSPTRWIVRDLFEEGAFGMIHGPSGSGKSFITIDIAMHLACGQADWHGSPIRRNGPVVYLAGEGHYGMRRRLAAWVQHYGHEPSKTQLHVSQTGCDLDQAEGYQQTLDAIRRLDEPPMLIVVDTLHRFLSGDENSAKDSRAMITACDQLREEFGCSLILVHHTGVSEEAKHRARGSSAWKGAVDFEFSIASKSDAIELVSRKSKDGPEPRPRHFAFQEITLDGWVDEDGNPTNSVVILPSEAKEEEKVDTKTRLYLGWFEEAWTMSERVDVDGRPYLSRVDMLAYLQTQHNLAQRTAENHLAPSRDAHFVKTLATNGKIEKSDGGWVLRDPGIAATLMLLRNQGAPSAPLGAPNASGG